MTTPRLLAQNLAKIPQVVWRIMKQVHDVGDDIFLVGGAVRNLLLNQDVGLNYDLTTSARPEKIQQLFEHSFYNNRFGMVGIPVWRLPSGALTLKKQTDKPFMVVEITTYRSESGYSDHRRPDKVSWGKKLSEDLKRRDFTINALSLGWYASAKVVDLKTKSLLKSLEFVDLSGGLADLSKHTIKTIGSPDQRFREDALRLMRAVRFASQLKFEIEASTKQAIIGNAHLIQQISWERIRQEFFKILTSQSADYGVELLNELGLLEHILPEIIPAQKVILSKHHKYDLWHHLIYSLARCPDLDPVTRLAALIHDVGKIQTWAIQCQDCQRIFKIDLNKLDFRCPSCHQVNDPRQSGIFYNHEVLSARLAKTLGQRFKLDKKSADKLYRLVRWHQFSVDETLSDKALRRFIRRVGVNNIPAALAVRIGDRLGSGVKQAVSWRMERFINRLNQVQKQPFSLQDLKVTGHDVMQVLSLKPSPQVGQILNQLFQQVVDHKIANTREDLLKALKSYKTAKPKNN